MGKFINGRWRSELIWAKRISNGVLVFKSKNSIHLYYDCGFAYAFFRDGSFTATYGKPNEWSGWRAFWWTLRRRKALTCTKCMEIANRYEITFMPITCKIDLDRPEIRWLTTKEDSDGQKA